MTAWLDSTLERLVSESRMMWPFILGSFTSMFFPCYMWSIIAKDGNRNIDWFSIMLVGGLIGLVWGLITWALFHFRFPTAPKWGINLVRCAVPVLLTISVTWMVVTFQNDLISDKIPGQLYADEGRTAIGVVICIAVMVMTFTTIRASTDAYVALRQTQQSSE